MSHAYNALVQVLDLLDHVGHILEDQLPPRSVWITFLKLGKTVAIATTHVNEEDTLATTAAATIEQDLIHRVGIEPVYAVLALTAHVVLEVF